MVTSGNDFIKYKLPPYAPLQDYYLGYAIFNFWLQWIVGLAVSLAVSAYGADFAELRVGSSQEITL